MTDPATAPATTQGPRPGTARRLLAGRSPGTVERLVAAATDEVGDVGYARLTLRGVARGAGVSPATAYTYFASKDHLLTEIFRRRLVELPEPRPDGRRSAPRRVSNVLGEMALLVADEPGLAVACTAAMFATDQDVRHLRTLIGAEMHRRLVVTLGDDADPAVVRTLELAVTGATVQAGLGHVSYWDLPARLAEAAELILGKES